MKKQRLNGPNKLEIQFQFRKLVDENKFCLKEILSTRKEQRIVEQRRIIAIALSESYGLSLIGWVMNRDHSSIYNLLKLNLKGQKP